MQTLRNSPTPTATVTMSTGVSMWGTLTASTWRSGSETVMATPSRKLSSSTSHSLRVFIMREPTRLPMGVMAISAPSVNSPIPATSSSAPMKKSSIRSTDMGISTKQTTLTMSTRGKTEPKDSCSLSDKVVL